MLVKVCYQIHNTNTFKEKQSQGEINLKNLIPIEFFK